jgi:hypothetical protein
VDYSIFGDTPGPSTSVDPEGPLNLAHQINITTSCWALGLRWYRATLDITAPITGRLWQATGIATGTAIPDTDVTFALGDTTGWKTALFTQPIPLDIGAYKPAVHVEGRWALTGSYFSLGQPGHDGITVGPLTMPGPDAAYDAQGSFSTGPITTYPGTGASNRANYWVDLLVTDTDPEGGPEVADYTIAGDEIGVHAVPLVASTVSTFTFADDVTEVTITNMTGTAPIYYTLDGTAPTVAGAKTRLVPADIVSVEVEPTGSGPSVVKLISPGTPTVSVARS